MADLTGMLQASGNAPIGGLYVYVTEFVVRVATYNTAFDTNSNFFYDWTVPGGVNVISAVAVGGGGAGAGSIDGKGNGGAGGGGGALSYAANILVSPGETLRIYAGRSGFSSVDATGGVAGFPSGIVRVSDSSVLLKAIGGAGGLLSGGSGGQAADGVGDGKYSGANGTSGDSNYGGEGGGAAGYSANGNTGLGGSGATGTPGTTVQQGGGGVGLFGEGASGTPNTAQGGSGGTNGTQGGDPADGGAGGLVGGGGGGSYDATSGGTEYKGGPGGGGAVRIIWGTGRAFPSTLTSFADSDGNETTIQLTTP